MVKVGWAICFIPQDQDMSARLDTETVICLNKNKKQTEFNTMYCYFESQVSYQTIKICHVIFQTLTLHFCTYPSLVVLWFSEPQNEPTGAF